MFFWFLLFLLLIELTRSRPARAAREIRLSCSRLMMYIDPSQGFPRSVALMDRLELKSGLWGDIETAIRSAPAERLRNLVLRTHFQPSQAITTASGNCFDYRILRQTTPQYLDERYEIVTREDCVLETFSLLFEPEVAGFRYHWFTGEDLGFVLFSHIGDPTVNLAMVLIDGKLRAYESPQGYSHLVLAYTDHRRHPEADEYPNPPIPLKTGESLAMQFRLFWYRDMDDLESKWRTLCGLPWLSFDRAIEAGRRWQLQIRGSDRQKAVAVSLQGRRIKSHRRRSGKTVVWSFETKPQKTGLQRVEITYEENGKNRSQTVLFYAMSPLDELLEHRCRVILSVQQSLDDPCSPLYGGIYPYDFVARQQITGPGASLLRGGAGEMLASAILVLLRSHLTGRYEPREIRALEIHANQHVKHRLQQNRDESLLDPLTLYPAPYPEGSTYIAKEYLELSRVPSRHLTLQIPETYLLWAYRTLRYSLNRYREVLDRPYAGVILEVLTRLEEMQYLDEASLLRNDAQNYFVRVQEALCQRVVASRQGISVAPRLLPDRMLAPLLQWLRHNEAEIPFKEWEPSLLRTASDIGFSYDPRLIASFRASGPEMLRPQAPGVLTMPTPATQEAALALLEVYKSTGYEKWLGTAYQAMLNFYTLYDSDYAANLWPGALQPGEASSYYIPTLYYSDVFHDTLDGVAEDQDAGLLCYLSSFGQECFETSSGRMVNGERVRNRYTSWAPFPRQYTLKRHSIRIDQGAVISWVEIEEEKVVLQILGGGQRQLVLTGLMADTEYVLKVGTFNEREMTDSKGKIQVTLQLGPGETEKVVDLFPYDPEVGEAIPTSSLGSLEERTREYVLDGWVEQNLPPIKRRRSRKKS